MLGETSTRLVMNAVLVQANTNWKGTASKCPARLAAVCSSTGTVGEGRVASLCWPRALRVER